MASLKKLASIPSLTQLYRKGIVSPSAQPDLPAGNQSLNEKICTIQYDITKLEVDAIVNAANKRLLGGGGVDGAIHRAAGPGLYRECKTLGGCDTGSAKITDAYNLPCKKVIHAVGPIYYDREESEPLLRGCYKTALELAARNDCKSIAFSAISTGIYGYPSDEAAEAALDEVRTFLHKSEDGDKIDKVIFVNFMQKDVDAYSETLPKVFPAVDESAETATDVSVQDTVDSAAEDKAAEGKESSEKTSKAREDATSKEESAKAAAQNTPTQPTSTSVQENFQAEMAIDSTDVPSQLLQLKDEDVSSSIDIGKLSIESRPTKQEYTSVKPSGLDETGKLETELEGLIETDESAPKLQPADKVDESSVGVQRP